MLFDVIWFFHAERVYEWIYNLKMGRLHVSIFLIQQNGSPHFLLQKTFFYYARSSIGFLVGRIGFEPMTNGLKVRCSTS